VKLEDRLTIKEALERGFTIDTTCYPHFGYKGRRFSPTEKSDVYTEIESHFIELYGKY